MLEGNAPDWLSSVRIFCSVADISARVLDNVAVKSVNRCKRLITSDQRSHSALFAGKVRKLVFCVRQFFLIPLRFLIKELELPGGTVHFRMLLDVGVVQVLQNQRRLLRIAGGIRDADEIRLLHRLDDQAPTKPLRRLGNLAGLIFPAQDLAHQRGPLVEARSDGNLPHDFVALQQFDFGIQFFLGDFVLHHHRRSLSRADHGIDAFALHQYLGVGLVAGRHQDANQNGAEKYRQETKKHGPLVPVSNRNQVFQVDRKTLITAVG